MRHQLIGLVVAATLCAGLVSCADQSSQPPTSSTRLGLDNSIDCPEGEVGWRFPKNVDPNSEEYARQAGEDATVDVTQRYAINVQSVDCAPVPGQRTRRGDSDLRMLRNQCGGELTCQYATDCLGTEQVTYTCAASDKDDDGNQKVYTASSTNRRLDFGCTQPASDALEQETRTACVPRQCHGRARRDLNMNCVEDPSIIDVAVTGSIGKIRPKYRPQSLRNANIRLGRDLNWVPADYWDTRDDANWSYEAGRGLYSGMPLYPTMPYDIDLDVYFNFGLASPNSQLVVWIDDRYTNDATGEEVSGFRCIAFKRPIHVDNPDHVGGGFDVPIHYSGTLARACQSGRQVARDNAVKKSGVSRNEFSNHYQYAGSTMHLSYDMEGRTAMHNAVPTRGGAAQLAYSTPECAPNPQDFFYDNNTGTYDLVAYYGQREIAQKAVEFVSQSYARRAYLIPGKITAPDFTIRTHAKTLPTLPVELTWYGINLSHYNIFNPFAKGVDIGGAWDRALPGANYAPQNVHATVYLQPMSAHTFGGTNLRILGPKYQVGEIPLADPNPNGRTQTANLPIKGTLAGKLAKETYESDDGGFTFNNSGLFKLFYCIESDPGGHGKRYDLPSNYRSEVERVTGIDEDFAAQSEPRPTYSLMFYTPRHQDDPYGTLQDNCYYRTDPLQVTVDRYASPLEPIASTGLGGSTHSRATGDDSMGATNDNDSQVDCQGQAADDCVEAVDGANRTSGESGRSTYDVNSELARKPGDHASATMTAELLGYQLIDPADPESDSVSYPSDAQSASSNPVTVSVEPDWDGIRAKLQTAAEGTPVEWNTGKYAGQMGLGVGWGFKWLWGTPPVSLLVTLSMTAGASASVSAEFQFAPNDEQKYPCLGTDPCYEFHSDALSFGDAASTCNKQGGRLGQLGSSTEAAAVKSARGSSKVWLGAQLAYYNPKRQCEENFNESQCTPTSRTEFRWLSDSEALASTEGTAEPTYYANHLFETTKTGLKTLYPEDAAVAYKADGSLDALKTDHKLPYVCVYKPAARDQFLRWQLSLNVGATAGINLTGCTPTDNPGFCLSAGLNVIALSVKWVYENVYHWLSHAGENHPFTRRGTTHVSVPWSLKLFEGSVDASVNFLWFSTSWNLLTYDGVTAAEGKLLDSTTPVFQSLQ